MTDAGAASDPKQDPRNRLAAGLFFAAWAAAGWVSLLRNPEIVGVDFGQDPGPGLMPAIVLTLLTGGSLVLVGAGLATRSRPPRPRLDWGGMARQAVKPALLVLTLLGYVPLVRAVGFVPASAGFAVAWMLALAAPALRREGARAIVPILAGTAAGVGLIYFVFIYWIGVPLR